MEVSTSVILALDIGLKRIGVAKAINGIPMCLNSIFRKNRNQAAQDITNLIAESHAKKVIVGFPHLNDYEAHKATGNSDTHTDSSISNNASLLSTQRRIAHFVSLIALPPHTEIIFFEESFSSFEALEKLEDKKMRKKANSKSGILDSLAALVILERYLMSQKQH